ncbi:putative quercetin-3-sulfate 4'-sulfotransferase [Helianthus annuus]|uniref:Sulfotransferase n=1 Tax=Helianthus annuus TaxID=4232 RepID=A0A251VM87_HELAN|nr:putative quercetin-3-sulfate 4'-sulfotransferase [Helianthus annuus]KAJ0621887.1 putative quercetin-3-sulfate 4'-sulfotransferase [Helianthus annuus]KAJ0626259.1 putative quercetin-3-sulfate 4'-sulfotransferase [Helianthus annuus]KAJ0782608.1 putative quercetin-3-sulfate 4'-sulfotransferase [Helianthus annuus]KAJ0956229.1 putative quercetin-3-sulfate 4'-sulfotransferase [Helianthus annuus]
MFHFANKLRDKSRGLLTFEETFELFSKGIMPTGPYWDHVKGYNKASLEHPEKVLFLTYEDMKIDTMNNVKGLARYLGYPFTEEEEAKGAVEGIVKLCSFENLSEVNMHGNIREDIPNDAFFREGKVGEWTNHLTDEMSSILDESLRKSFMGWISLGTTRFVKWLNARFSDQAIFFFFSFSKSSSHQVKISCLSIALCHSVNNLVICCSFGLNKWAM